MNDEEPDFYSILGVSPASEDVVIHAAYRALMRRYHPDANPSAEAARKAKLINRAYSVLSSPTEKAAYDDRRTSGGSGAEASDGAPPPPDSNCPTDEFLGDALTRSRSPAAILVYLLLVMGTVTLAGFIAIKSDGGFKTGFRSAPTMNVDENLTTTDMNVDENLTTQDPNTTDRNAAIAEVAPEDLSHQAQTPVNYTTIETAASHFANLLLSHGISGARAYSEQCHKSVQNSPTWDGIDGCAAFDFAAASIDNAVSNSGGFPRDRYFEFQQNNQADNYTAAGAPLYVIASRLSEIKQTAEESAADALQTAMARKKASARQAASNLNLPAASTGSDDPFANDE
jgi:curved DNA-binding protein CbpA